MLIQIFKVFLVPLPFCTLSSLKLPLFSFFEASVPSFDACSQRWLLRYHTRAVQCFAAAALAPCSLAHPACFRKASRTLFVHTELTVASPLRTSNVILSVRSSHRLSSSDIPRPSSAKVSARSLIGSPRCDFTFIRKAALPARVASADKLFLVGCQRLTLWLASPFLLVPPIS